MLIYNHHNQLYANIHVRLYSCTHNTIKQDTNVHIT